MEAADAGMVVLTMAKRLTEASASFISLRAASFFDGTL
jgi:hypothetical protein